ncbi:MAG: HDOD domain-containing protein [Chthonomonadales bacterium]
MRRQPIHRAFSLNIDHSDLARAVDRQIGSGSPSAAILHRILSLVNDPRSSAEELSRVLALDRTLTEKTIRMVNSAAVGLPANVTSIRQAVILLGYTRVRTMAVALSAYAAVSSSSRSSRLDTALLWKHSVAAGAACATLAAMHHAYQGDAETAFVAGLLHDIGKRFLDHNFQMPYAAAREYARREALSSFAAEERILNTNHARVGRMLAEHLQLPVAVQAGIGNHHDPRDVLADAAIVHAADWLVWQAGVPSEAGGTPPLLDDDVARWLGFQDGDFERAVERWQPAFSAAWDALGGEAS